jgi:aryl-alcohol dehydrogenase-like predicted oxidoreductase
MAVMGLGLAALGRPAYLTVGHGTAVGPDRSVEALEQRCGQVCDAAWDGGIRWFDAARSYGLAEQFLAHWLARRPVEPEAVTVSSKWGYTYTAGWKVDADIQEVKDHSLAALDRQWPETDALLGPWLDLYQVHSLTPESPVLDDAATHHRLAGLGVLVGISLSGPGQADALRRALGITVEGRPLFRSVQATWNPLETSVGPALAEAKAAGWTVIVKEALANGRLAGPDSPMARPGAHPELTALATALAQPWADVVLSGATTVAQLRSNLTALDGVEPLEGSDLSAMALDPRRYWSERANLPWT